MKKFSIPGYFHYFNLVKNLLNYRYENPEKFYEDRIIDSSYDLPGGIIWNGGRVKFSTGYSPYELDDIMDYYFNETDIKLAHTCTNLHIDSAMAQDWMGNWFLNQYYRDQDYVIIASPDLHIHLMELFPNMNFVFSTTVGVTNIEKVNEISSHILFVVDYNRNNNNEYLKALTHPENIEIICAEPCQFNCPNRRTHYEELSDEQLFVIDWKNDHFAQCAFGVEARSFREIQQLPHAITNERVDELSKMGINHFKISGRTISNIQWIETMTYYLVKPEYLDEVQQHLILEL